MKKSLQLLFIILFASNANAQNFWARKNTGFVTASRGLDQITYAKGSTTVAWATAFNGGTAVPNQVIQEFTRTSDGGDTWTPGSINLGNPALGIGSIAATSATTAYVAAFKTPFGPGGGIWKTTDGGLNWVKQATALFNDTDAFADFVGFFDQNEGIAVGDPTLGSFEIYRTLNGGALWTRVPSSSIPAFLPGEGGYTRNYFILGNKIWFGTNKGRLYSSPDRGLTWTVNQSPSNDFGVNPFGNYAFTSSNNGLYIEYDFAIPNVLSVSQFSTTNGGVTWTPNTPTGVIRGGDVTIIPGVPNAYVNVGADPDVNIRGSSYTLNGGLDWIDVNTLGDAFFVSSGAAAVFASPTAGLASGFTTSSTVGGAFKYVGPAFPLLSNVSFPSDGLFNLAPNPTFEIFNIYGKNINQVQVIDVLGKVIINNNYSSLSNVELNIANFNAGVYMVKVTNNEGKSSVVKVVKQ